MRRPLPRLDARSIARPAHRRPAVSVAARANPGPPIWLALSLAVLAGAVAAAPGRLAGAAADAAAARPLATVTATPVAEAGVCTVSGWQAPGSTVVERGQIVPMELRVSADCPEESRGRADIVLVVDRSASMKDGGKWDAAKAAVTQFVENIDFTRHRVGLVPFSDSAFVAQPLIDRPDRLVRALDGLDPPAGGTNIAAAIEMADRELRITRRLAAVGVLVVLTDGRQSSEASMVAAANNARERGFVLFSVGLGADAAQDTLRLIATSPDHYYFAPTADDLADIYQRIAALIRSFSVTDVRIFARLAPGVSIGPGGERATREGLGPLGWWRAFLTPAESAVPFAVRMGQLGRHPVTSEAWLEYLDGDGVRRRAEIAPVELDVVEPSVRTLFLPLALDAHCFPALRFADVALVIDASASMAGEKLQRAVGGARAFIDRLELAGQGHQVALVRYDGAAELVAPLTSDEAALDRALDAIVVGSGTRIDLGLVRAIEELTGPRHREANQGVIVLLSDGRQVEARTTVSAAAAAARARGLTLFVIAFGTDADVDVLLDVAGSPARLWLAPDAEALEAIYREVAGAVACR